MKLAIKKPLTAALQNAHDGTCISAAASAMGAWPLGIIMALGKLCYITNGQPTRAANIGELQE